MIVQSTPVILKQRNQPNRECLYAWYPEVVTDTTTTMAPRDIYIHKGIDKDLIQQNSPTNRLINGGNNNNSNRDLVQRYKQSLAPSDRIYHSTETIDEALTTPWALHYEIQRRPATPNPPSHSNDISTREEIPRRLKSAPLVRSLPPTSILTIPEPRFTTPLIPPFTANQIPQSPSTTKPRVRAASAKARLNTTFPIGNEQIDDDIKQQQPRREIKSAQGIRPNDEIKVSNVDNQKAFTQTYSDIIQQQDSSPIPPTPPPAYVYQRSASWCANESATTPVDRKPLRTTTEINSIPLNPHYIHRPGVVSVNNSDKKPVVRESSASKKTTKHHRRHRPHHYHHEKRSEPLLALTPMSQTTKLPFETDGIKLIYDPTLTLDDPSLNLTKYFIEGRLYLIKDQRYNVLENIDPSVIEKYNQNLFLAPRPKYYQTIPIEKFQVPKPPQEIHYNASETYFYNTLPKRVGRYVIDPHFISENLNVNKISLSKRPSTATVVHSSTINDINRQQTAPTTVYA